VRALQGDVVEFLVLEENVLALLELVALHTIFGIDRIAGFGVDHLVADAVAGLLVDDVEADALAGGGGGVEGHRAGHQRQLQKALPVRPRGHDATLPYSPCVPRERPAFEQVPRRTHRDTVTVYNVLVY